MPARVSCQTGKIIQKVIGTGFGRFPYIRNLSNEQMIP